MTACFLEITFAGIFVGMLLLAVAAWLGEWYVKRKQYKPPAPSDP